MLTPKPFDDHREIIIPGSSQTTLLYCALHFVILAEEAIHESGAFFVALSGGSTPKALFECLTSPPYSTLIQWDKIHLFWSDERAVSPDSQESNYHMAMHAGLAKMPIPKEQIHRMRAEEKIEEHALLYQQEIAATLKGRPFDLIMLGMGEDGHTASLFPDTQGLKVQDRNVIANFIPQKKTWRMTLTYACINQAKNCAIYVLGASKADSLAKVLLSPDPYPVQKVGTKTHPALWIVDRDAAAKISVL